MVWISGRKTWECKALYPGEEMNRQKSIVGFPYVKSATY